MKLSFLPGNIVLKPVSFKNSGAELKKTVLTENERHLKFLGLFFFQFEVGGGAPSVGVKTSISV